MWKKIGQLIYTLILLFSTSTLSASTNHLQELNTKFPYGLLGDDYGILTTDDLAINTCRFKPHLFPPEAWTTPFEYWMCFESKNVQFECDSSGIADDHEGIGGLVVVKATRAQNTHEYIERRPWPIRECRSFLKNLKTVLKGSVYVCISGSFLDEEKNSKGKITLNWLFERLKTRKGCEGRECIFTAKMHREICPELKL